MSAFTSTVEDILDLKRVLIKEKTSAAAVSDVLNSLEKFPVNRDILKKTGIVKTIHSIVVKENRDILGDKVVTKANELIRLWKSKHSKQVAKGSLKRADSLISVETAATKLEEADMPEDPMRKRVCTLLRDTFKDDADFDEKTKMSTAIRIEESMLNLFQRKESKEYKAKFRTLKFNLAKNHELRKEILNGYISTNRVVSMKPEELADPVRCTFYLPSMV